MQSKVTPSRWIWEGVVAAKPLKHLLIGSLLLLRSLGEPAPASAQTPAPPAAPAATVPAVMVPGFWDPKRRQDKPTLPSTAVIRFLTETDYPPFDYAGPDGNPAGLNVDLAR